MFVKVSNRNMNLKKRFFGISRHFCIIFVNFAEKLEEISAFVPQHDILRTAVLRERIAACQMRQACKEIALPVRSRDPDPCDLIFRETAEKSL